MADGSCETEDSLRKIPAKKWCLKERIEQAMGVGDGQGNLACCGPRGRKELDTTE